MVNVLGRVGQLEEAKLLIATVALEPSAPWRACRTYGSAKLGEFAATELLKWEPKVSDIH